MSKLRCRCGHVISDTTDALPYKAALLADEDDEVFWVGLTRGLAELLEASRAGRRQEWITRHFLPGYPTDLDDENVISDFMTGYQVRFLRTAYRCTACGRLLVADPRGENRFRSFVPEDGDATDLLSAQPPRAG